MSILDRIRGLFGGRSGDAGYVATGGAAATAGSDRESDPSRGDFGSTDASDVGGGGDFTGGGDSGSSGGGGDGGGSSSS